MYPSGRFDAALAQLVLHIVSDPVLAAAEMRRVVRPGGVVAVCVWGLADGMEMSASAICAVGVAPGAARNGVVPGTAPSQSGTTVMALE